VWSAIIVAAGTIEEKVLDLSPSDTSPRISTGHPASGRAADHSRARHKGPVQNDQLPQGGSQSFPLEDSAVSQFQQRTNPTNRSAKKTFQSDLRLPAPSAIRERYAENLKRGLSRIRSRQILGLSSARAGTRPSSRHYESLDPSPLEYTEQNGFHFSERDEDETQ
jgi:hypothetical protein